MARNAASPLFLEESIALARTVSPCVGTVGCGYLSFYFCGSNLYLREEAAAWLVAYQYHS